MAILTNIEVPLESPNGKRMGGTIESEMPSSASGKYVTVESRRTPGGMNG